MGFLLFDFFTGYSFNSDEVKLEWFEDPAITLMKKNMELPDFKLIAWSATNSTLLYPNGNWDRLEVTFIFRRRYGFFILQAYVPTYLTIIVSWVSFSMNTELKALPARSTVGVSSLVALTYQFGNILQNLPKVSYMKALDVWMLGIICFEIYQENDQTKSSVYLQIKKLYVPLHEIVTFNLAQ